MKEKDLFPPLKKYFKDQGYTVYAEVPCFQRGVDFVAAKGDEHIAVEMKLSFSMEVFRQARGNVISFGNSYVAYPVKKPVFMHDDHYWKLPERTRAKVEWYIRDGVGILQVLPSGLVFKALDAVFEKPYRVFDFSQYQEKDDDEAGLPYQKGVSAGYRELEAIKAYVRLHPAAKWPEIYAQVQNHYSSPQSLAGSMGQWRGFSLPEFKKSIAPPEPPAPQTPALI